MILSCISDRIKYKGIILWILVQSDIVSDLIFFAGHCDIYFMTLSYRKTSYKSLKQMAGSTSCPWTTILVTNQSDDEVLVNQTTCDSFTRILIDCINTLNFKNNDMSRCKYTGGGFKEVGMG